MKDSISVANSGTLQSRLSAAKTQPRLRTPSYVENVQYTTENLVDEMDLAGLQSSNHFLTRCLIWCLPVDSQLIRHRFLGSLWGTIFLVYCALSLFLFSLHLSAGWSKQPDSTEIINFANRELSPLENLPLEHLFSKLTTLSPPLIALDPYIIKATAVLPTDITACLWTPDSDIDMLPAWAMRWQGESLLSIPLLNHDTWFSGVVSLVVTTTTTPSSSERASLLLKLAGFSKRDSQLNSTLSVHILHLDPNTEENPNAFLNIARLFSQTQRVALFPSSLSSTPPKALYRTLTPQMLASAALTASAALKYRPVVFTVNGQTAFPFSSLSPVLIDRDDPVWCTERFFPALSRSADWEECLWQMWLENFGDLEVQQMRAWMHGGSSSGADSAALIPSPLAVSSHSRFYRTYLNFATVHRPSSGDDSVLNLEAKLASL